MNKTQLNTHTKEFVSGAAIALVIKIFAAGSSIAFGILLARLLGPKGAGIYYIAFTIVTVASTVARFGLNNSLVRFISSSVAEGNSSSVKGVYVKSMVIGTGVSTLISLLICSLSDLIALKVYKEAELAKPLFWISFSIIPFTLFVLQAQALQGLKKIRDSMSLLSLYAPLFSLMALAPLTHYYGVVGAAWSYTIAATITLCIGLWRWNILKPYSRSTFGKFDTTILLNSSIALLVVALMDQIIKWSSLLMLGIWDSSESVGMFGTADRLSKLLTFIMIAVNSIAAPKFAELFQRKQYGTLEKLARNATMMQVAFAIPVIAIFILTPELVLKPFGNEFIAASDILIILTFGQFISAACGSVGYILMMTGHEKSIRNNMAIFAAINITLNIILIPGYGSIGAAWATTITISLSNVLLMYAVWKRIGILTIPLPHKMFNISKARNLNNSENP